MADISQIELNGNTYDLKDSEARESISDLESTKITAPTNPPEWSLIIYTNGEWTAQTPSVWGKTVTGSILHITDAMAKPALEFIADIEPIQSGSGDPSPENIRLITGHTGADVVRTGKNLFGGSYGTSNKNPIPPNVLRINFSATSTGGYALNGRWYDSSGTKVGSDFAIVAVGSTSGTTRGSVPSGATQFILFSPNSGDTTTFSNVIACDYSTIPITFPAAAGTVYGGTLTNEGEEWELRVDRVAKRLLTARNLSASYPGSIIYNRYSTETADANFSKPIICNRLKYVGNSPASADYKYGTCINASNTSFNLWISNTAFADLASASAWLAENETQICYYLATPVEYTLSNAQALKLLKGENNIWVSDSTNLELTYLAKVGA